MSIEPQYIDLDKVFATKAPGIYRKTPRFLINWLKRKVHVDELNEILRLYADKDGVDFMESVIGYFNLKLNVYGLENIPREGRFIFTSNHPLGGLDGICLSAIIGEKYDKKIRYQVNDLLMNIKNLRSIFIPINSVSRKQSKDYARLINEAFDSENQIITFPAGLCSRKQKGKICDLEWKKSFIQKAVESERDVVPVYFHGQNSKFFYRFANIRKALGIKFNLEMLFLSDELFKQRNQTFSVVFGTPIPYSTFDKSRSIAQWAEYVKEKSYELAKTLK
ncbi:1-acyl-sn-glycerol-3-phosphate acyltransferase [Dysgonomonas sp. 25]|uniref:1-acyl-sn-glycerol-3-phosphate acyltransferase n=1 Tax=Dysgonomonas sp. 25 TaxID=2302933 RepID=UPI0013CFB9C9|nr:1-acyl-sn-glycerol-3-phosphate acyltransferase [Dysgonomonas sp. 25]NDV68904.1 glycerol acyltransferase [Dysgonomonas sp. 25]